MDLFYQSYGTVGPPVIILHGLLGSHDNWHSISLRLAGLFRVIAPDLRNHGRSPHSDTFDYTSLADDLRCLMDTLGIQSAFIIGHSMGGKAAMQFALQYPERCDRLIVVDIAPREYDDRHTEIFDVMEALDLSSLQSRHDADVLLAERIHDNAVRQFLLKNLTRTGDGGYAWKPDIAALRRNYPEICRAIGSEQPSVVPALFLRGELSDYVTDDDIASIETVFSEFLLVTVPGADHWIHADAPDAFFNAVCAFLTD